MGPKRRASYLSELLVRFSMAPSDSLYLRDVQFLMSIESKLDNLKPGIESPESYKKRRNAILQSIINFIIVSPSFRALPGKSRSERLDYYISASGLNELSIPYKDSISVKNISHSKSINTNLIKENINTNRNTNKIAQSTIVKKSNGIKSWFNLGLIFIFLVSLILWLWKIFRSMHQSPTFSDKPLEHDQLDLEVIKGKPRIARSVFPPERDAHPGNPST